jgi:hypothetical protein
MWFGTTLVECYMMRENGLYTFLICTIVLFLHLRKIVENLCQGSQTLLNTLDNLATLWTASTDLLTFRHLCFFSHESDSLFSAGVPSKLPNEWVPHII